MTQPAMDPWTQHRLYSELYLLHCLGRLDEQQLQRLPPPEESIFGPDRNWIDLFTEGHEISVGYTEGIKRLFEAELKKDPTIVAVDWCHKNVKDLYENVIFCMDEWPD